MACVELDNRRSGSRRSLLPACEYRKPATSGWCLSKVRIGGGFLDSIILQATWSMQAYIHPPALASHRLPVSTRGSTSTCIHNVMNIAIVMVKIQVKCTGRRTDAKVAAGADPIRYPQACSAPCWRVEPASPSLRSHLDLLSSLGPSNHPLLSCLCRTSLPPSPPRTTPP
jgi:hypothetical protein